MKNKQKVRAKFRQQHNLHDSFFKQIFKKSEVS